ncbi:peroxide stress protein YaaA [Kineothrix sp. MB12-C1]|uniref:peroxide stress protein YaaA n=1 Tax=Kineothrix sp. MB12-C1 TaxID=3070215 RepID=UPI0027D21AB2|nr:peroxide stress protein YaaA [Kineothrix sp. MB12-C1]WMC93252.1 peroxide stress protein YaaA [Kineothrix sp. MB12-C1]
MKVIISPAKKMNVREDLLPYETLPVFLEQTESLKDHLKKQDRKTLQAIWKCNDSITDLNIKRLEAMDLTKMLTPAVLSYEGLQYQHMAPAVFNDKQWEYIKEHLYILSGFYGLLRAADGIVPYRLEMQAVLKNWHTNSLYHFWKDSLAMELLSENNCILNLASKEYSKCITPYLREDTMFVTCVFGEMRNGKVIEKGTYAKMARGEMVRFMAEKKIKYIEGIKDFNRLGYSFQQELSNETTYIFVKNIFSDRESCELKSKIS